MEHKCGIRVLRKFLDKNAIKVGEGVYMGDSGRGMIKLLGDSGNVTETEPVYFNNKKVNEKYSELVKGVIN